MKQYICKKKLDIQQYDDDGFMRDNEYSSVYPGEIWTEVKQQYNIVASNDAIHLEKDYLWIEIHKDTLKEHFTE